MKIYRFFILTAAIVLMALCGHAQTTLNGRFYISGASEVPSTPNSNYSIEGKFTDMSFTFTAADILPGDVIADNLGLTFRIDKITKLEGDQITVDVTYLKGATQSFLTYPSSYNVGALFRPTSKGYALGYFDQENINDVLRIALQNSAVLDIDRDIRGFKSGTEGEIPKEPKFGDIFYNLTEKKLYAYTANGWVPLGSGVIASGTTSEFPNPAKAGEMFFNKDNDNTFIYNGAIWFKISTNGSTPSGTVNPDPVKVKVKEGDLFHNTSEHKLYVYNGSIWVATDNSLPSGQIFVGNASNVAVPVTLGGDATMNGTGKLTIKNGAITDDKLDKANIPLSGFALPLNDIKLGDDLNKFRIKNLNYPQEASDAATMGYVDGLFKDPTTLLKLKNNHFFVGNSSDLAVETDKTLIPISGFDKALANVRMGVATGLKYKIINMADPDDPQDAATRNYVDNKVIAPGKLTLLKGNLFIGGPANTAIATLPDQIPLNTFGAAKGPVLMGGFNLSNLKDPEADQDAATRKYVDGKVIGPSSLSLTSGNLFVGDANGKAADVLKNTIPWSGFAAATADVSMGSFKLTDVKIPETELDAANKKYVDSLFKTPSAMLALPDKNLFVGDLNGKAVAVPKSQVPLSGFSKAVGDIEMGDAGKKHRIIFLDEPKDGTDAATKNYVDAQGSKPGSLTLSTDHILVGDASNKAAAVAKDAVPITDFGKPVKDLTFKNGTESFRIIDLKDPVAAQDAATKHYVDSLSSKMPVGPNPPTSPAVGDTYYNTTDKRLYVYNGTDWVPVGNDKLAEGNLFVGNALGIAAPIHKNAVPLTDFGIPLKELPMGGQKIINLKDPETDQEAATKKYVDSKTTKTPVGPTAPVNPVVGDTYYNTTDKRLYVYNGTDWVLVGNDKLAEGSLFVGNALGIATPTVKGDVSLTGFGAPTAELSMAGKNITNLGTPVGNQDAVNKKYVDDGLTSATAAGKDNLGNHLATQNIKLSVNSISNDGVVGKGLSFDAAGNASLGQDLTINGNLFTPSDSRLKDHIETLGNVLAKIDQIRGVSFEYKDKHKYISGAKIGVIAQELQKVYPEMVTQGKDGFLKVDYTQLTGMLIQAVKEQQKEIEALKVRMDRQQEQINRILEKMNK